jgi:perosamine synthetase
VTARPARAAAPFAPETLADALVRMFPRGAALHEPEFAGNEWAYVKECLDTGWVSSAGGFVDRFETMLRELTGARHAVATVNGTAALHACLVLAGVARDDEVIVPALSFVATANAVAHCGAVPHFADCEDVSLGLDAAKLSAHLGDITERRGGACVNRRTGRRIAAVVPMHALGHPCDLDALSEVCAEYGLPLIEDAAESLGASYKGRHTGTVGRLGALSFNGNKVVTTGGGGALLTDDDALGRAAKHLTTTAKLAHRWEYRHDRVGFNYRMPNINAALGCAQLEQLGGFLAAKRCLAAHYRTQLAAMPGLRFLDRPPWGESSWWLNAVALDSGNEGARDSVLALTNDRGVGTRPLWEPLHRLPMFVDCPRSDLSVTEDLCARVIELPSSARLAEEAVG